MGDGIGQRTDHLEKLDKGPGPAMGQHQRQGVRVRRTHVQEVDAEPIDLGLELREGIQPLLPFAPPVAVGPVAAQVSHVLERHPLGPVLDRFRLGPPGPAQPVNQVVDLLGPDGDAKRDDLLASWP